MLVMSRYVKPGTTDSEDYLNHYSLLLSIEQLFGLSPTGYAADPSATPFSTFLYNNFTPSSG
jgi:hypothetical protein